MGGAVLAVAQDSSQRKWRTKSIFGIAGTPSQFPLVACRTMLEMLVLVAYVPEEVYLVFTSKKCNGYRMHRRVSPSLPITSVYVLVMPSKAIDLPRSRTRLSIPRSQRTPGMALTAKNPCPQSQSCSRLFDVSDQSQVEMEDRITHSDTDCKSRRHHSIGSPWRVVSLRTVDVTR